MTWLASRFELSRGSAGNLRPMEGLRGLAVLMVFAVHYATLIDPWLPNGTLNVLAKAAGTVGHAGVDLFFVLSGYLIYGMLISKPRALGPFLRRRIRRIYPTYGAVFALYVALSLAIPEENKIPAGSWPAAAFLTSNFLLLPGLTSLPSFITVAWSLSYEMFYYVVTPLLVVALGLRRRPAGDRVIWLAALGLGLVALCVSLAGPVRLLGFVAGMAMFDLLEDRRIPLPGGLLAVGSLAVGLGAMLVPWSFLSAYEVKIVILVSTLLVFCLSCVGRPASRLAAIFSWTPLRWLGNMSYSFYLIHGVTLLGLFRVFKWLVPPEPSAFLTVALLPIALVLAMTTAAALFLLVERPFSLVAPRPRPS